ncbi:MAG: hypothetical protein AUK06_01340 [Parcubacteria group bacterium CG2_30_36_18]|uniref:Radical SAM core domain-containing protein n=3 Tax=Candidatus Nealsoniibacteriota TaxID=1817911 RepID=A0A2M8DLV4_9BACT|nr:MAG: hypothetical protein AUK06_01340 [Parcubacteria group bacterium CG2_30_36_18]PIR72300.1 MAG: hypothetical protein COU41_00600 [Candidatus Nealsonbacteria bacterium CG10_big_fil_rev_8_21_14_0_10_36_228]PIX88343.1 MAG: hypothetical protein COZ30_01060 [Candidatus Nealsonbacteria bacterium CG_4_10_14_3_um_filter_36_16]PJB98878.1 MAG: hypothetical protein CO078_00580 [Candidatus Nealsonbacteria bacterium CG_4_9_14_0_8_um_filter_36_17]
MKKVSLLDKIRFLKGRILSLINNQLLAVSFEVTLSCNCNCRHCDLGGFKSNEGQIKPSDYANLVKALKPLVVQLSGGEPLLRKDILDIVKAINQFGGLPYTILVTNGVLLNEEIYLKLKEAGLDQLSISLDFPDERHDWFRRHPGLFNHLKETVPKLAKYGFKDIILNSCITKDNFREVILLAKKAIEWGVLISYSAYTSLRTGNEEFAFSSEEDLRALRQSILQLIEFKRKTNSIINSETVLLKFLKFLEKGYMPNCKAGLKFLIVMPDGILVPCSLRREKFSNLKNLRENFSKNNQCSSCYVAIRCYSERSIFEEIKELPHYLRLVQK